MTTATKTQPADSITDFRRRAYRHAVEDGAIDLVVGVYTLMVGVATQRRFFLALAVVYLMAMAIAWKPLHDRLTSLRTGYAELPLGAAPIPLLSAVLLAGLVPIGVVAVSTIATGALWNLAGWPTWAPVLAGAVLAWAFLDTACRSGVGRFRFLSAASVAVSVFFWLFAFGPGINPSDRLTLFFFVMAGLLLAAGGVAMARFVRTRPVTEEEAGDVR